MPDATDATRATALAAAPDLDGTTIAVTGANGFVGARTCALLAGAGATVRALVRREGAAPQGGTIAEVVTTLDAGALASALAGVDVVVHTAAVAGPDLETARAVNVDGTRTVVDAAVTAGVRRLVHVSTTSVIDAEDEQVDESAALVDDEASPYAVTKRDAETVVADAPEDLACVVLRPPAVLGWAPSSTWGQRFPSWVRDGEMPMEVDERASWSWVHVDDFATAIALAASADAAVGRTFLVASGSTDMGTYLGRVHGWYPDAPSPFTPTDEAPPRRVLDATRVHQELGWQPTVDFATAMDEIAAHHG